VNLLEGLVARGEEVHLLLARCEGELLCEVPDDVVLVDLHADRPVTAVPSLARYLRRVRPKALIASMTHTGLAAVWARALAVVRVPVIVRQETTWSRMKAALRGRHRWLMPLAVRLFLRYATIVAVSEGVARDLSEELGIDRKKIAVIYNPIVGERLRHLVEMSPPHRWLSRKSGPVVLGVGRLVYAKGFDLLIRAFARLPADSGARLIIYGEGPERGGLERLVADLGLEDRCDLAGYERCPAAAMASADLLVLSSRWEGMGVVLVEALVAKVPIVSFDCPSGPREVLRDGRYGRLVPPEEPVLLARAIQAALSDPEPIPADVEAWLDRFSVSAAVDAHLELVNAGGV